MNRVILIGRLTIDPETKTTSTGKSLCNFSIAVDRRVKGEADFFRCTAWGQSADYAGQHLKKGQRIAVDGRIEIEKYEKDGQQKEAVKIQVDNVQGLS